MRHHPSRRQFLAASASAALASAAHLQAQAPAAKPAEAAAPPEGPFKLEPLPYPEDALAPHIDAQTMKIHHGKHHQTYVNSLNTALKSAEALQKKSLEELLGGIKFLPEAIQTAVQNHGGGHWNHTFFWASMAPAGKKGAGGDPADSALSQALDKSFGNLSDFRAKFSEAATKQFGSGWAWLIAREDGSLAVVSTANQNNPLMQGIVPNTDRGQPLLGLDVWEHAYYLNYQNKRADYIKAWWNVVNWEAVAQRYEAALASNKKK